MPIYATVPHMALQLPRVMRNTRSVFGFDVHKLARFARAPRRTMQKAAR